MVLEEVLVGDEVVVIDPVEVVQDELLVSGEVVVIDLVEIVQDELLVSDAVIVLHSVAVVLDDGQLYDDRKGVAMVTNLNRFAPVSMRSEVVRSSNDVIESTDSRLLEYHLGNIDTIKYQKSSRIGLDQRNKSSQLSVYYGLLLEHHKSKSSDIILYLLRPRRKGGTKTATCQLNSMCILCFYLSLSIGNLVVFFGTNEYYNYFVN